MVSNTTVPLNDSEPAAVPSVSWMNFGRGRLSKILSVFWKINPDNKSDVCGGDTYRSYPDLGP